MWFDSLDWTTRCWENSLRWTLGRSQTLNSRTHNKGHSGRSHLDLLVNFIENMWIHIIFNKCGSANISRSSVLSAVKSIWRKPFYQKMLSCIVCLEIVCNLLVNLISHKLISYILLFLLPVELPITNQNWKTFFKFSLSL